MILGSSTVPWGDFSGPTSLKKTNTFLPPPPILTQFPMVPQQGGGTSQMPPPSMLSFWLTWFCASLVHIITAAVSLCNGAMMSGNAIPLQAPAFCGSFQGNPCLYGEMVAKMSQLELLLHSLLFSACWLLADPSFKNQLPHVVLSVSVFTNATLVSVLLTTNQNKRLWWG